MHGRAVMVCPDAGIGGRVLQVQSCTGGVLIAADAWQGRYSVPVLALVAVGCGYRAVRAAY